MKVLGHDYISQDSEAVAATHLFQDMEKKIAARRRTKNWLAGIATGGNKM